MITLYHGSIFYYQSAGYVVDFLKNEIERAVFR